MFFNFGGVNRNVIYGLLIALAVISLYNMGVAGIISLLLTLPAVIVAITFHEFAHAWTADKLGDTTPRSQGRLNLNPISHLDFFGFILMIFTHIGWGKPVQINPNNFNSNKSRAFCETMVSLAGPLTNFILAIVATIAYYALNIWCRGFLLTNLGEIIAIFLNVLIAVNIGLGTFNLIPLPPLDGEKIFRHLLPFKIQEWLITNYTTLYYVFIILWMFGVLEMIVAPVISTISNLIYTGVGTIFSLFI
jgi:Zn-dependent protease